jgi:hypothetical protein
MLAPRTLAALIALGLVTPVVTPSASAAPSEQLQRCDGLSLDQQKTGCSEPRNRKGKKTVKLPPPPPPKTEEPVWIKSVLAPGGGESGGGGGGGRGK